MNVEPQERNWVRQTLERLDREFPGARARAERVAVHAVATGAQLGLDEERLIDLRWAAELHPIASKKDLAAPIPEEIRTGLWLRIEPWLDSLDQPGVGVAAAPEVRILVLAIAFENALSVPSAPESAALQFLREGAGVQFDPDVVEAFLAVQPLIQPMNRP